MKNLGNTTTPIVDEMQRQGLENPKIIWRLNQTWDNSPWGHWREDRDSNPCQVL